MRRPAGHPTGGQFAPLPLAGQVGTRDLRLGAEYGLVPSAEEMSVSNISKHCADSRCTLKPVSHTRWCPHHNPHPERVTLKLDKSSIVLKRQGDGTWVPSRRRSLVASPIVRQITTDLHNTEDEVRHYCASVVCEMLSEGDIPPYPDFLEVATIGVRRAACKIGGDGAWRYDDDEPPFYDSSYMGISAMAAVRAFNQMSNITPKPTTDRRLHDWSPDREMIREIIMGDDSYRGEDGNLILRYAAFPAGEDGITILDTPSVKFRHLGSREWLATYVLCHCKPEDILYKKALGAFPDDPVTLERFFSDLTCPIFEPHRFFDDGYLLGLAKIYQMGETELISAQFQDYLREHSPVTLQTLRKRLNAKTKKIFGAPYKELFD